ncbi:endonuclease/exonuclease/phosphatase family protein [Sphingomonas rhizophila]|uniref:Endonuclease/exonuclease/phosphatase family protein n=1 Tax=Sphingomonas rhizophila TaxID=2071607 RepID=A0A7G9SAQ3_9SPHN|nr:endonuclease/exonuclease/phosphatase family protein [Sphingomonas rhizophila]QNN64928.1 endonuclease/exonuclease/phosphatase family protein [Sphingomonas rhizophila]
MSVPATVTVASYNMRKAIGTDRKRRPDRVLHVLQEIDADIVALQEADKRFGTRASAVPHELIDGHGLYKPVEFGVSHSRLAHAIPFGERIESRLGLATRNLGWHGNAILVKRDVEITGTEALHLPTFEPRGAVVAELRIGGRDLRIVGMHLDLSGLWRKRQVRAILDHIRHCHRPMPTVLMGDTNEWRPRAQSLAELDGHYRFAATGPSFHSRRPVAALDRIIVDKKLKIDACGVHSSSEARKASDHLPIWARLVL